MDPIARFQQYADAFEEFFERDDPSILEPYLTEDAARLCAAGFHHLLVDLPSVDREDDGGGLYAHRAFWGLDDGQTALGDKPAPTRTITELCRLPAPVGDGLYLLSLQVAPLAADAAPSRPVLFAFEEAA